MTERELIEKMKAGAVFEAKYFHGTSMQHRGLGNHFWYEIDGVETPISESCIEISLWLGHIVVVEFEETPNDKSRPYYKDAKRWRYGLPE